MNSNSKQSGLNAEHLLLFRGERCLLDDVSLSVAPGEGIVLKGPNGTGKTTLLRVLCGLSEAEEGVVCWNGTDIRRQRQQWHKSLGWSGHLTGFKGDLTVTENLTFIAGLHGTTFGDVPAALELEQCLDLPVRALSAGQKRRAALAGVLLAKPAVWLLDEPYTNLDAQGQQFLNEQFRHHLTAGGMLVMATHGGVHEPVGLSSRMLEGGRLS